jgi:hypothetical protein
MLSVRAAFSTEVCGQLGPLLTTATRIGRAVRRSTKNGAPESYGQGVVSAWGAYPRMPVTDSLTDATVICPVRRRVTGAGLTLVVEPYPVSRTTEPTAGASRPTRIGLMSVMGVSSLASATSAVGDCRTATTLTSWPAVPVRSVRPTVAVVRSATGYSTRTPSKVRKQCPAVITQRGATRAPEQALLRRPPSAVGIPVMVSFTENVYLPSGTGSPLAIAAAGPAAPPSRPAAMAGTSTADVSIDLHLRRTGESPHGSGSAGRRSG